MSIEEVLGETMVPASSHHALRVVVESLKNRCQLYNERLKILEKERTEVDGAVLLTILDNANLRRLLYESMMENQRLRSHLNLQRLSNGNTFTSPAQTILETCERVPSDSSSSVEVISSSSSSSSSMDTIISRDERPSVEPRLNESTDEEPDYVEVQRALAQALENKRALCRQMEFIEEIGDNLTRMQLFVGSSPPQDNLEYSSLDSFEVVTSDTEIKR